LSTTAPAPSANSTQRRGADHQRALRLAQAHELVRHRQSVHESGACSLEAERRASIGNAETVLQQRAHVGKHEVGRGGAHADEVDVGGAHLRIRHGPSRCMFGEVGRGLALRCHMTAHDAGAGTYPLVAGVDQPFEIGVGQYLLRKKTAGAGDA